MSTLSHPIIIAEQNDRTILDVPTELIPRVLPADWVLAHRQPGAYAFQNATWGIQVLISMAIERDKMPWLHISLSRRDKKIPKWTDLQMVRELFAPKDCHGVMLFPPEDEYVHQPYPGEDAKKFPEA
ncbi:MAG: hypothetical protein HC888_03280, partial [Candidatus Competibacteraceae bacterium]|nr:hypothetical protein [Candidatus Competibacteraceae bacterium]